MWVINLPSMTVKVRLMHVKFRVRHVVNPSMVPIFTSLCTWNAPSGEPEWVLMKDRVSFSRLACSSGFPKPNLLGRSLSVGPLVPWSPVASDNGLCQISPLWGWFLLSMFSGSSCLLIWGFPRPWFCPSLPGHDSEHSLPWENGAHHQALVIPQLPRVLFSHISSERWTWLPPIWVFVAPVSSTWMSISKK